MLVELGEDAVANGLRRVSGIVRWEARDRPAEVVYVAVATTDARGLADDADWLLLGTLTPAQRHCEPRLRIEAPVSPLLVEHLRSAQGLLQNWYGERPVPIETPKRKQGRASSGRASALFLSGGLDSVSSLFTHRGQVPLGYPGALRYGVNVDFLTDDDPAGLRPSHKKIIETIHPLFEMTGVELLPVSTNLRRLEEHEFGEDWMTRAHGATLAAVAHALSPLAERALIASSFDYVHVVPWGSHPMLDPLFSSSDVVIDHHNAHLSRYAKLKRLLEIGGIDAAKCLIVCIRTRRRSVQQAPNCGRCEKCLRTLVALTAAGIDVQELPSFEERALSPALIRGLGRFRTENKLKSWSDLVAPLAAIGREDLSKAVAALVRRNAFFDFDRRHLHAVTWRAKVAVSARRRARADMKRLYR